MNCSHFPIPSKHFQKTRNEYYILLKDQNRATYPILRHNSKWRLVNSQQEPCRKCQTFNKIDKDITILELKYLKSDNQWRQEHCCPCLGQISSLFQLQSWNGTLPDNISAKNGELWARLFLGTTGNKGWDTGTGGAGRAREEKQVLVEQRLALEASYFAQEIMVVVKPSVQEVEPRQQDTVNTKKDGDGELTNQQEA